MSDRMRSHPANQPAAEHVQQEHARKTEVQVHFSRGSPEIACNTAWPVRLSTSPRISAIMIPTSSQGLPGQRNRGTGAQLNKVGSAHLIGNLFRHVGTDIKQLLEHLVANVLRFFLLPEIEPAGIPRVQRSSP